MFNFIVYGVLFLLGFFLMGLSFNLESFQGLTFSAGIIAVSAALAVMVHAPGGATKTKH